MGNTAKIRHRRRRRMLKSGRLKAFLDNKNKREAHNQKQLYGCPEWHNRNRGAAALVLQVLQDSK